MLNRVGPLVLGTACTALLHLVGFSASLSAIIAVLVASFTAYIIACVTLHSDAIFVFFLSLALLTLRLPYVSLPGFYLSIFKSALCETSFTSDTM